MGETDGPAQSIDKGFIVEGLTEIGCGAGCECLFANAGLFVSCGKTTGMALPANVA
jgi:hypothetical protein